MPLIAGGEQWDSQRIKKFGAGETEAQKLKLKSSIIEARSLGPELTREKSRSFKHAEYSCFSY